MDGHLQGMEGTHVALSPQVRRQWRLLRRRQRMASVAP